MKNTHEEQTIKFVESAMVLSIGLTAIRLRSVDECERVKIKTSPRAEINRFNGDSIESALRCIYFINHMNAGEDLGLHEKRLAEAVYATFTVVLQTEDREIDALAFEALGQAPRVQNIITFWSLILASLDYHQRQFGKQYKGVDYSISDQFITNFKEILPILAGKVAKEINFTLDTGFDAEDILDGTFFTDSDIVEQAQLSKEDLKVASAQKVLDML